jgi:hypothetical protein
MFSPPSFFRKGRASVLLIPVFLVLCLCLGAGLFTGCDTGTTPPLEVPGTITPFLGTWFSGSDGYEISNTTLFYDDGSNGVYGMSFAGNIRQVSKFGDASGVIIVEYTSAPTAAYSNYTPAPNFIGIYYRILAPDMIKLANSYDMTNTDTPDLGAAIAKFSQINESTFVFSWRISAQFRQAKPVLNLHDLEGKWLDTGGYGNINYIDIVYATYTDKIDSDSDGWGYGVDSDNNLDDDLIQFVGVIQETTNAAQNEGIIYIRLTNVDGFSGNIGEYYAVKWQSKSGSGAGSTIEFVGADGNPQTSLSLAKSYLQSFGGNAVQYSKQ